MRSFILFLCLLCFSANIFCQIPSDTLKVYFLYGSVPKKAYKDVERKWFGGKLGGHVGIELDSQRILNFLPRGKLHIFAKDEAPHGYFATHNERRFWSIFGGRPNRVKKLIIHIPVTPLQRQQLDSIAKGYLKKTPYDYAFFGMRCGASTYEILAQLGILRQFGHKKTIWKIFYPKRLRKRLLKLARQQHWKIDRKAGTSHRKWEKDPPKFTTKKEKLDS